MTDTNPFWEFSISFYARPDVANCCLELQENSRVDVNVLLFCLWRAHCGEQLRDEDLRAVDQRVSAWRRDVVQPLRRLRQQLREYPEVESTRELLKAAELESERVQQAGMWQWQRERAPGIPGQAVDCIPCNLACLARLLDIDPVLFDPIGRLARTAVVKDY